MQHPILYAFAFFSGCAALVYQVAWSRSLSLTFGSSTLAVSAVVAGFMGGMGIGAWLYHRVGDRGGPALRGYGLLEVGIALSTALLTLLFAFLPEAFAAVATAIEGDLAMRLVRVASVFLLLLVPSALMGATYPALVTALMHTREEVDLHLGWIYGINTIGAAVGALLAGFALVEFLGARGAVFLANVLNLVIGVAALAMARNRAPRTAPKRSEEALPTRLPYWVTGLVLVGSGLTTLGYEIVWFRSLRYIVGNGTYVLTNVLVVFLLGLGFGGLAYRRALRLGRPEWNLALCQLCVAVLALLAIKAQQLVLTDEGLSRHLSIFSRGFREEPWPWRLFVSSSVAIAVTLPATLWMGLAFPLASRLFVGSVRKLSARAGLAYLLSNLGSIAGSISAALFVLPRFGTVGGTKLFAALNLGLGLLVLARAPGGGRLWGAALAALALVLGIGATLPTAQLSFPGEPLWVATRLVFEEEAELGTVQVRALESDPQALGMQIDGSLIGANRAFLPSLYDKQTLLAHLPLQLDRRIRHALVVGVATGATIDALSRYEGLETIDAVEINPGVIRAAAHFADSRSFEDPRVVLRVEDAVHFLLRSPRRYDLVVSDGKLNRDNPGNAKLLSREFYRHALARLEECGLFVQWIPMSLTRDAFAMVLRTFHSVFPEMELFLNPVPDSIVVGSRCPLAGRPRPSADDLGSRFPSEEIRAAFLPDPLALPSFWVGGTDDVARAVGSGPLNTWEKLPVQYVTYRSRRSEDQQTLEDNYRLLVELGRERRTPPPDFTDARWLAELAELNAIVVEAFFGDVERARRRISRSVRANPSNAVVRKIYEQLHP